jgi:hypothetical protein
VKDSNKSQNLNLFSASFSKSFFDGNFNELANDTTWKFDSLKIQMNLRKSVFQARLLIVVVTLNDLPSSCMIF